MHRLLIRILLESDLDDDLDAVLEREIELPFVPRRGLRLDFADDGEDGPVDLVLRKTVWRVAKNRFEFEMTERGENGGTVLALMDEWTQVGFTVVDCSSQQIWDGFRKWTAGRGTGTRAERSGSACIRCPNGLSEDVTASGEITMRARLVTARSG